ncbi:MAG TPA: hypothetical protein VNK89_02575 [Thermoflexus sp.]|nr:hypothetical protein [Thermoflexus sp.]
MHSSQTIFQGAEEVFKFLIENGGLDPEGYDSGLIEELCKPEALDIQEPCKALLRDLRQRKISREQFIDTFSNAIRERRVSIERFIGAFFKAIEPYGRMMNELCVFFVRHGARRTNEGMRMLFDFGNGPKDLGFDLRHFREWAREWRRITQQVEVYDWDSGTLWELGRIFREQLTGPHTWENFYSRRPQGTREWLDAYSQAYSRYGSEGQWLFPLPEPLPEPPRVDVPEIDTWLERAWRVWESVVRAYSAFGPSDLEEQEELRRTLELPDFDNWDPKMLRVLNSDRWPEVMAIGLYGWAEDLRRFPLEERLNRARPALNRLNDLFSRIPRQTRTVQQLTQALIELLHLPIWRRRHELYQVWVLTQIDEALKPYRPKVHHVDGTLLFSFSGTHVATAECEEGNLHIWSELRTPLKNPIGRGRKKGIQPDYTIALEPITNPLSTRVVVETKQYARASVRDFVEALIDYARGRPNARVILVNYGAAPEWILDYVPNELRQRTMLLGCFRPREHKVLTDFQRLVRDALPSPPPVEAPVGRVFDLIAVDISASMADQLKRAEALEILRWAIHSSPGARLLAVDTEVQLRLNASDEALRQLLALPHKGGTNLPRALSQDDCRRGLVITDPDGWQQLENSGLKPKMVLVLGQQAFVYVNAEM